jgi:hypothetical protein
MYHLSTKQRYRIVEEYERVGTISQTSRNLKLRPGTCRLWVNRYLETGGVEDKPGRGRKPILSEVDAKLALDLLVSNAHEGPSDVAKMLVQRGASQVLVHRCTIQRAGRRAALQEGKVMRAFRGKPHCKFLGQRVVHQRLTYCKDMLSKSFATTLFTDRCKFAFEHPGCVVKSVVYGFEGEPRSIPKVNHPKVFNVYGGICQYGVTDLIEVAGTTGRKSEYTNKKGEESKNITSAEYEDVLRKGLLPSALSIFRNKGMSSFVFLQDNDPTHNVASGVIKAFNSKNVSNITMIKHPSNSPDLNPIENVWGYVKMKVERRGCESFSEFKAAVREEFRNIPVSMLKKYVKSMKKRLLACQNANGQRTRY